MLAILKKELRLFFSSSIGYFVIGVFLITTSLFLWFFDGYFNILETGFADLTPFFTIAPWLFSLLIPGLTMGSFSDEYNFGTIEILKTKPLKNSDLLFGKYLAVLLLICFALLPTAIYSYSIYILATPTGNIDFGILIGSYIGLLFIASAFASIGLWVSTFSKNQLIVLLTSIVISLFSFYGFEILSNLSTENAYSIQQLGMYAHFKSIAKGVIDTRDLIYFFSVSILFLGLTAIKMNGKKTKKPFIYTLVIIAILNSVSSNLYSRLDLSSDKRYTLSETSINILNSVTEPVVVRVYLEGDFPVDFKRLQIETLQLLSELKAKNKFLKILLVDPKENLQKHIKNGLTPSRLTSQQNGVVSEMVILPWATIHYGSKKINVSLLKDSDPSETQTQQLESSIENLEFAFVDALKKITSKKEKSIAILSGNGELKDLQLYSFLETIGTYYHLAKFTLDSVAPNAENTLEQLKTYNLAIIAKPTEAFSEKEKYVLDQYVMSGGKTLWMLDNVHAEMDSLYKTGKTLAFPRNLNLEDFFFRYGIRINHNLVKDLYASKIALATGNTGNKTNFQNFLWFYHPLLTPKSEHPIVNNISNINTKFVSSIDLLKNEIKKTPLLESSILTRVVKTPNFIDLKSVAEKPDPKIYNQGKQLLGVLLEGSFTSAYKDRQKPFETKNAQEKGINSKMIVIADGDIATNQIHKGKPLELGVDKWTQQLYGNKEFLLNSVDYLLDDTGLLELRSKKITLRTLNLDKVLSERNFWQVLNICIPLLLLFIFGVLFNFLRKRKYT